jgi:hypothetical protein
MRVRAVGGSSLWIAILALSGCELPMHAYGTVAATNGVPGRDPAATEPRRPEFGYHVLAGVNPMQFGREYVDDPSVDLGLGYEFEQMPLASPPPFEHGPYALVGLWPSLRPVVTNRVGFETFGELLFAPEQATHRQLIGWGTTAMLALEFTDTVDRVRKVFTPHPNPAAFGHGRGALGLYFSTSFRSVGVEPYWMVGVGVSVRAPIVVIREAPHLGRGDGWQAAGL